MDINFLAPIIYLAPLAGLVVQKQAGWSKSI